MSSHLLPPTYDYLIVGAGLFGATFARTMTDAGKRCLVLEQLPHIGGNCYTENQRGIDIHIHGPHIFHTSNPKIWEFVNRFAQFNTYQHLGRASVNGKQYSLPLNLNTFEALWGVTTPEALEAHLRQVRIPKDNPDNIEDYLLSIVGQEVYETFFKGYTTKQWQKDPKDLPAAIVKRLPIRLDRNERYFNDIYEGIPTAGYTAMIAGMLAEIEVRLGVDYLSQRDEWDALAQKTIYTGPIDAFFNYQFGPLEYRGLRFEHEWIEIPDYQGISIINYPEGNIPFTRIVEHQHFNPKGLAHTLITKEYSETWAPGKTPYYPVCDQGNTLRYRQYWELANPNTHLFGGRLGEYRYYDMHQAIGSALKMAERELSAPHLHQSPLAERV